MATYRQIQELVKEAAGFVPQTCWIADLKNQHGLTMRAAPNRKGEIRVHPCPKDKRAAIEAAMKKLGMIH
jgi:hypothetical protein